MSFFFVIENKKIKELEKTELFRKEYTTIRKEAFNGGSSNYPKLWCTLRGGGADMIFTLRKKNQLHDWEAKTPIFLFYRK